MPLVRTPLMVMLVMLLAGCAGSAPEVSNPQMDGADLLVFLVRHAEKATSGEDPPLTEDGSERAQNLAALLKDSRLLRVHSTDYERTRSTAGPTAKALGLETEIYDPRNLENMAANLKKAGGRHLVVGHSNTTPRLVELLGGEPGEEINEKCEYDRLYIVAVSKSGQVKTVLFRYGKIFKESACSVE